VSSTLYTIGTALRRAHDHDLRVVLLVESHWLSGRVAAVDGHGVILDLDEEGEHSVVKLDRIAAVRVHGMLPDTARASSDPERARLAPEVGALQSV
jgi:hypothetical protein